MDNIPAIVDDYINGELLFEEEFDWSDEKDVLQSGQSDKVKEVFKSQIKNILDDRRKKRVSAKEQNKISNGKKTIGYVYLLRSGRHYKIGKANQLDKRIYQLKQALPEEPVLIHSIETSDPFGIEQYWHRRFKKFRKGGEFFELTDEAVEEFKAHSRVL